MGESLPTTILFIISYVVLVAMLVLRPGGIQVAISCMTPRSRYIRGLHMRPCPWGSLLSRSATERPRRLGVGELKLLETTCIQ